MRNAALAAVALVAAFWATAPSVAQEADTASGERLFRQRCGTCHQIANTRNGVGPHLQGPIAQADRHLKAAGPMERGAMEVQREKGIGAVIANRRAQFFNQKPLRALSPGSPAGGAAYQDVSEGIAQEELKGLSYMFWGRLAALAVLAVWALTLPFERSAGYLSAIAAFALLGAPPYLLARHGYGRTPVLAAFLMLDAVILTNVLVVPPPFYVEGWTAQLNLRLPNFLYLGIFLVGMSLSYSPWLVMWAGIAAIVAWSAGFLWVASLPDTLLTSSRQSLDSGLSSEAVVSRFLDPRSVSSTNFFNQIVFLGLATLILTATVWRSRQLVRRQVAAESGRASLSRYFSPNIVRELSANTRALDRPIVQPAAILFADMVGFTRLSERMEPEALVGLLREFHGRLARVVFANSGTIDKYIGDAIMVHFGTTPRPRDDDPVRR